jgi:hypothetical protein
METMLFAVPFYHSPGECPRLHKTQMEETVRRLSPESLGSRGIRLVEGYVDRLCLEPTEKAHFSYFLFEAEHELQIRDLFEPNHVEIRALERFSDLTRTSAG